MIINYAEIEKTAVNIEGYPQTGLPEIAFVGKSNVGKSSLINCLAGRKALARTSSAPGKTRTINFFNIDKRLYFVDLPGYGYAKVSKTEKEKWGKMIEDYLRNRASLKAVILLIDIRHEPSENDKLMFDWFKYYGCNMILALTKCDKLKKSQLQRHISQIKKGLSLTDEVIVPFSSETKEGRMELWSIIQEVLCNL